MDQIKFKAIGASPLLMHADTFANPLNPLTKAHKELTSKRKKTDEDQLLIAKSEWRGSLYYDKEIGIYIPGQNIDATMIGGAKLQKLGTTIKRGAMVLEEKVKLIYDGPTDLEAMWADEYYRDVRGVRVGNAKVMRYRPRFNKWAIKFTVNFNPEVIDRANVIKSLEDAGAMVGLCDNRPRYGQFLIEVIK